LGWRAGDSADTSERAIRHSTGSDPGRTSKMQSLMSTYIAAPLKTINQYEQSVAKYEQEVMYPLAAINQAKTR
jgi:hypothetical protein